MVKRQEKRDSVEKVNLITLMKTSQMAHIEMCEKSRKYWGTNT